MGKENTSGSEPVGESTASAAKKRGPVARWAIRFGRIFGFGYAAILCTLLIMENRLVYPAAYWSSDSRDMPDDPEIRTVDYQSGDGTPLRGRLLERADNENTIVFFHGNGTKAVWQNHRLKRLASLYNATVLAAEYRGYLDDDARPTSEKVAEDGVAAVEWVQAEYSLESQDIILYGSSLGGGVASAVAAKNGAKALVLERTFDRLSSAGAEKYPFIPVRLLMQNEFDSVANLSDFDAPVVQIHGDSDRLIPIHLAKVLFDSLQTNQKKFFTVSGMGHNGKVPLEIQEQVAETLREFLQSSDSPGATTE